ncbi:MULTISPECIES: protein-disulfide reductase DsbD [Yersiniaceae]|uniref:protein-disulfide reductase DsbD n=1 Tax=Yersiniaceae TaxID=1903411 RepID=UPI0009331ACC|nr:MULTISPECIES: protein-disulfide reductase DsbD [Yersiniaceae]MDV5142576.1 protein-disulfide reductase DsbD [Chimaeribacter arupi]
MDYRLIKIIVWLCGILLLPLAAHASLFPSPAAKAFVPPDQAFAFDFSQKGNRLTLNWQIKPGYYLYRQQIQWTATDAAVGDVTLPEGLSHKDEFFGISEIYKNQLAFTLPITQAAPHGQVKVTYQGCAEAGFCYPPETRIVPLSAVTPGATADAAVAPSAPPQTAATAAPLPFSPLWALLIGIGIAFTPCVLPMYPLISGIILGREKRHSHRRVAVLALVYVQGMALTYTLLGLVVAAAGLPFQAALQSPGVLIALSVLFILLALSMFGLFTLQLPSALQTRLTLWSNTQRGGSLPGVFVMGALAGLICSPCTTAPLSAILLYIAQSGNLLAGGGTLYLYALGMGIPLVAVTLFGNRLLPRSGPWMNHVKEAFGFVILALPVFLLTRIIGDVWGERLWSLLGIAFFGWAFLLSLKSSRAGVRPLQLLLLAAALVVARPLQEWVFPSPATAAQPAGPAFQPITSRAALAEALHQAQGKRVMLDLYADWCVACKEFEKYTFSQPAVQEALADTVLLQADVTGNSPEQQALLAQLQVLGLPTILFFGEQGREIPDTRITGFMDAAAFRAHLQKVHP